MAGVFVTGAGGFIGQALVRALVSRGHGVTALVHASPPPPGTTAVRGDLLEAGSYRQAVTDAEVVVHLAAATGNATASDHARINATGTRYLATECGAAHRPLLFVSTVAVQYPDHSAYPYAAAKAAAEVAVRESGAPYVIARPTIVAGPGSPVIGALARLALLPVVPVFGNGRTLVQPVDVDDVAGSLADLVEGTPFGNETVGIGGPDIVTVEALLQGIRKAAGREAARVMHLPFPIVLPLVAAAARLTGGRFPLGVGQLSLFRFDGTVTPHPVVMARKATMHPLPGMLRRSLGA